MKISGTKRISLTVGSTRCAITLTGGPWIEGIDPAMIKMRPKGMSFPQVIRNALIVHNNSESREDYFEVDHVKLTPGHPLYPMAKEAVTA